MTSEERLVEALKLDGNPSEYSTSYLMQAAVYKIKKLQMDIANRAISDGMRYDYLRNLIDKITVERDTLQNDFDVRRERCKELSKLLFEAENRITMMSIERNALTANLRDAITQRDALQTELDTRDTHLTSEVIRLNDELSKQESRNDFQHAVIDTYAVFMDRRWDMIKQREADAFRLLAERDEARTWARKLYQQEKQRVDCPECDGSGYFSTIKESCVTCNGTGKVTR